MQHLSQITEAMHKTRNTGTESTMRGTRGMGEGKCCQIFLGKSTKILVNVVKYSGECLQTFPGMSSNILGMSSNILGNVLKHSVECRKIFQGMSPNISRNFVKHYGECLCYSRK